MQRLHLVELEDLPWVPDVIRDCGRDLLDLGFAKLGFYNALVPRLLELIQATGVKQIVDLASGGGGGALAMYRELRSQGHADVTFLLTDRYPNANAAARVHALQDPGLRYHPDAVDALNPGKRPAGIRTMYGALHHFQPKDAQRLMQSAVQERAPIALFDVGANATLRSIPTAAAPIAALPNMSMLIVATWLLVPLLRPIQVSRLLLTYLLPLIPVLVAWDGTVSAMRAYSADELLQMAKQVPGSNTYVWEAGASGNAVFLTGRPRPG